MRYGAIAVVRAIGGLDDTVIDEGDTKRRDEATGFKFLEEDIGASQMANLITAPAAFAVAVERSLQLFRADPARWNELMANGADASTSMTPRTRARGLFMRVPAWSWCHGRPCTYPLMR
jgi:glycogen synthase